MSLIIPKSDDEFIFGFTGSYNGKAEKP